MQPLIGTERIKAALVDMPSSAGVYRMLGEKGDILYVGKAKNLRNRVANYASGANLSTRIMRMVSQIAQVEITTTKTEAEALLLEANLIKKHRPRYNILLKDDKSFPYILIAKDHPFPRIEKHRGAQNVKGRYFGPFASVSAVNETLALLQKAFLLRPCSDTVFKNRTRPCLQYQIKRCSAPCVGYIAEAPYTDLVKHAEDFLSGKSRAVQDALATEMDALSAAQQYEKAALLRDRIRALTQVQQEQGIYATGLKDADVMALAREGEYSCIQVFFFRGGAHFGQKSYFPKHDAESTEDEILSAFVGQFYQSHTPPPEVILSTELSDASVLEEALALRAEQRVVLATPQRGDKKQLLEYAEKHAQAALTRHRNAHAAVREHLAALAKLMGITTPIARIEVYDNSHIMGAHALGAMIVATLDGFAPRFYRKFNIKDITTTAGDDYAMMREVFRRRLSRLMKEDPTREHGMWPDVMLIDGGAGQLQCLTDVLQELGIANLPYMAIAKGPDRNAGREQFFLPPNHTPFTLPPGDGLLHYLQQLRDEAHRYAIGSHRDKRSKALSTSLLDEIPNIGTTRKRALLQHFGSKAAVEQATIKELAKVPGISKKIAEQIYGYFHG